MDNIAGENSCSYPACASCKLQRRKCDASCELAPYFPANRFKEFQNVHRLFGVSNIQKMMASVKPSQKQDTADSLLTEGNFRRSDPVHGCYGVILNLKAQVESAEKELETVKLRLALCKEMKKTPKTLRHRTAPGTEAEDMTLRRRGGGSGLSMQVQAFPVLTLSPSMLDAPVGDDDQHQDQHHKQMLYGVQFPSAIDLSTDAQQDGYVCKSTLEEGADYLSPFDPQMLGQVMESFQQRNILGSFHEMGDQSSASFIENAKHTVGEEKEKGDQYRPSMKGKELVKHEE